MTTVTDINGNQVNYEAARAAMDADLLKEVEREAGTADPQALFEAYARRHAERYLQPFAPHTGGEGW